MTGEDDDEAMRIARDRLSGPAWEDWAGGRIEILDAVDVLWSGWEADSLVALVRLPSGETKAVFVDGVSWPGDTRTPAEVLEERVGAYEAAADRTRAFLAKARALEIMDRAPDVPPDPGDEMPDESEQDRLMREIYDEMREIGSLGEGDKEPRDG